MNYPPCFRVEGTGEISVRPPGFLRTGQIGPPGEADASFPKTSRLPTAVAALGGPVQPPETGDADSASRLVGAGGNGQVFYWKDVAMGAYARYFKSLHASDLL